MRTYSTPQSALDGEITKLAILECVASAALYVGIGVYFGTFKHLAVAVAVAPLMLFRTEFSADWGLQLYKQVTDRLEKWAGVSDVKFLIAMLLMAVIGTGIRLGATAYWGLRRPLQTLRDTPRNWLRQCFCTDFAHPPEVVPKEAIADPNDVPRFADLLDAVTSTHLRESTTIIALVSPLIILGWLPSLIYRVSFKATALAYIPFVWVARATVRNPLPLKARLERLTKGELEKVRRGFSWMLLSVLAAKLALVIDLVDRGYVESKFPSQKIVVTFVVLDGWPWWQLTLCADALLTFFLLFFADAALGRIEAGKPWREDPVTSAVAAVSFLRAGSAVVTVSYFFFIALAAAAPDLVNRLQPF
jgi:hypothetical protein